MATTAAVEAKIAEVKLANELLSLKATVDALDDLGLDVGDLKTSVAGIETLIGDLGTNETVVAAINAAKQAAIDAAKEYTNELADGAVADNADAIASNLDEINKIKALIGTLDSQDASVAAAIARLEVAIETAEANAITAANGYADGLKAQLEKLLYSEEEGKEGDIVKILAELEVLADAIDTLDTKTSEALATAKTELEGKINTLKTELEGKINAEKAEREEADVAIKADLEAAVAKLNKTIVTITVILGVVSLALAGCVVFIFLKKKA